MTTYEYCKMRQGIAERRASRALDLISRASACYRTHAECAEVAARSFERAGRWRDLADKIIHSGREHRRIAA